MNHTIEATATNQAYSTDGEWLPGKRDCKPVAPITINAGNSKTIHTQARGPECDGIVSIGPRNRKGTEISKWNPTRNKPIPKRRLIMVVFMFPLVLYPAASFGFDPFFPGSAVFLPRVPGSAVFLFPVPPFLLLTGYRLPATGCRIG